ncbi:MAG TPA: radical SAM protein [Myxococcota bacterium]|nr:radical SAM protein [Myxococcota bacterium]
MARIDLKTGFRCNNRCTFCVQGDKRERYVDRDTAECMRLITESRAFADEIVLTGGEVTIRKDLCELVAHARDEGFSVIQIQTNGRMLAVDGMLERLVEAGVTEVSPALHGADAATHEGQTRAPGSFRQTVRGIRRARALSLPVLLNSVVTRANHEQLEAMAELFVALEVDQFQLAFVHALGTAGENFDEVVPRFSDTMPHVIAALAVGVAAGVRCMTEGIPLCLLPGFESFAAERIIPRTRIVDAEWVIEDYSSLRVSEGKAKGPECAACRLDQICEGPWREYPEHYGWEEFRPPR